MPSLSGVKVLDLSRLLPGPYASLVLADLGAQVDKLEDPNGGDYARMSPPFVGDTSALFASLNRNKRSVCLDLKSDEGKRAFKALVKSYDVVLEGFRPGVMDRLGLGYEALRQENERLILCALSGYGHTGPDSAKAGHDVNFVARAGLLGAWGDEQHRPQLLPFQVADIGGALFAAIAIVAALFERTQTNTGRKIDVSLLDSATAFHHLQLATRWIARDDNVMKTAAPTVLTGHAACYNVYRCADSEWLSVGSLEPQFLTRLAEAIGVADCAVDAYEVNGVKARDAFARAFATKSRAEWLALLLPLDVCVEPIASGDAVFADQQLIARGVFQNEPQRHVRTPVWQEGTAFAEAPQLGAHSDEILNPHRQAISRQNT
jgi:alpha-methylacyl-CoA racemase